MRVGGHQFDSLETAQNGSSVAVLQKKSRMAVLRSVSVVSILYSPSSMRGGLTAKLAPLSRSLTTVDGISRLVRL